MLSPSRARLASALASAARAPVQLARTTVQLARTTDQPAGTKVQLRRTTVQPRRTQVQLRRTMAQPPRTRVRVARTRAARKHGADFKSSGRGADPSSMPDYMPRPDANFDTWATNYFSAVQVWWGDQGFDPAELDPLSEAFDAWIKAYKAHVAAQNAAEAARQEKDTARRTFEGAIRPVTTFVQGYAKTTNADRATIGISVRGGTALPSREPTTAPNVSVSSSARLTHHLKLVDSATPTRKAKPQGVLGAEVWVKLVAAGTGHRGEGTGHQALGTGEGNGSGVSSGPVPSAQSQVPGFSFLTLTTRPSLRTQFKPQDGGKTAVYMLRWVSTRGEKGPWSEIATATVAA